MLINSLEKMEQIVSKNRSLSWDGWVVVELQPTKDGTVSKNGIRIKGRWYIQNRYDISTDGWEIPNKFVG
jgi:hypothetical protein